MASRIQQVLCEVEPMYRFYLGHQNEEELEPAELEEVEKVRAVAIPGEILEAVHQVARQPQRVIDRFKDILYFKAMKTANLSYLKLRDEDIAGYVAPFLTAYAPHIVALDLHGNDIGRQGLQAISHCKQVTILDIHANQVTDLGVEVLSHNNYLKHVDIGMNGLSSDGLKRLVTNECLTSFSCTEFQNNQAVVDAVIESISQRRKNLDRDRKLAFLMGMHPRLGQGAPILHSFFQHRCFEPMLVREVFSFLRPEKIEEKRRPFPAQHFCFGEGTVGST